MKALFLTLIFAGNLYAAGVDTKASSFKWKGTKVTGEHYGQVSLKSANLKHSKDGKISSGEFVIDMDSVTVGDLSGEWATKFLNHIKSPDFFNVPKFPTSKLVVTSDNGKVLKGKLTIKGKTNDITIPYKKSGDTYKGTMTFDRTKYDMKYGSGSFFKGLGDKMIHDKVTLSFEVKTK